MDMDDFEQWLDDRGAAGEFSGAVVAWRDGRPIHTSARGLASRRHQVPNEIETRFHVASITKIVTAIAALRLVEAEVVTLHGPLTDVLAVEERPRALTEQHTLHHLLSHTSGLANYHDDEDETPASFEAAWVRVPPQTARGPRDLLPLFADRELLFPPGADFRYGDVNYIMIGILLEALTGQSFSDVATDLVLGPAGMEASTFAALDADPPRLATGYLVEGGPVDQRRANIYSIPAGGQPDGGLITTGHDLCRLIDAILEGRLIEEDTLALAMREYGRINDDAESYGYGLEMLQDDGDVVILGHAGGDPGISAMLSHYVRDGVTVAVLCNQDRGSWAVAKQLATALDIDDPRI